MCGIVGYVGCRPALPVLLDGLRRLEYRGYDSAGVALQGGDAVVVCKRAGRVEALTAAVAAAGLAPAGGLAAGGSDTPPALDTAARAGIGHTRWATHGGPSDRNAHPHADERLRVAVVHNGIIENHAELREELRARGHVFRSETDSEVVAHLVDEALTARAAADGAAARVGSRGERPGAGAGEDAGGRNAVDRTAVTALGPAAGPKLAAGAEEGTGARGAVDLAALATLGRAAGPELAVGAGEGTGARDAVDRTPAAALGPAAGREVAAGTWAAAVAAEGAPHLDPIVAAVPAPAERAAERVAAPVAGALREAVRAAVARLRGSFALVAMSRDDPDVLVGARQATPLVVGVGRGEQYIASDIAALLPYTREVLVLRDGEMAEVRPDGVALFDFAGRPVEARAPERVAWDVAAAERGGYAHFMRKEIDEQPEALAAALRGRCAVGGVVLEELEGSGGAPVARALAEARRVVLLGCGTAYHAALVGRALLERWTGLPADADIGSEFRYREPLLGPDTVAVAVSQSGETADTLAALREARARGAVTLAVVNVVGSGIAREADAVLYTRAGPEIAVASTKAYTTQIAVLSLLAHWAAARRGAAAPQGRPDPAALAELPGWVQRALALEPEVARVAARLARHDHCFFIGRGLDWATAVEGQLKLKEVSYLHAEAYAAGELKHGTLALIEPGTPVVALCTQPHLAEKTASNVAEVRARGGWVVGVATPALAPAVRPLGEELLTLPAVPADLAPAVAAIPLQLLAYHTAVARGCDVDRPRNLAKSVTVE